MQQNNKDTTLYLSNIPSGLIATNSGIQERHDKYKKIIQSSAQYFYEKNQDNQKDIIIETLSYSNLLGAMIAKTLAEANFEISELNFINVANSYGCFQSADNIANTILSIKPNAIENIKEINTASDSSTHHPVENGQCLANKLKNELSQKSSETQVNNAYVHSINNGKRERYTGKFNNGKFNGKGKLMIYNEDGKLCQYYEGDFKDGKINGKGKLESYNEDGKLHKYYKGDFNDCKFHGTGKLESYNEDGKLDYLYKGEFNDGMYNGKGKLKYYQNKQQTMCYEGGFQNGLYNGTGKLINYKDGKLDYLYEGEFKDDKCNGKGKLMIYNEDRKLDRLYEGGFQNGLYNGTGKLIYFQNKQPISCWKGKFKNGKHDGKGEVILYDKDRSNNDNSQHSQNNDMNNSPVQKYNLQGVYKNDKDKGLKNN